MKEYIAKTEADTQQIAVDFAQRLKGGEVIALSGNLGAGKTVFVKALAQQLGVVETVTSPTFVLMKVYNVKYKNIEKFVHVDCYRLQGQEDLSEIGLADYLGQTNMILAVEWADRVIGLPTQTIKIHFEILANEQRKITIQ